MPKNKKPAKSSREQYASLQPRVKTLKEATIRKRWKKLPIGTQAKVADLLRTVERPALTNGGSDRKNLEVQAVVSELVEGLVQRLPRMPFPPGTDEMSFDFESTINRQRVLEEQLTANTHTLGLLGAEAEAETGLLEQEMEELNSLEKDLAALEEADEKEKGRLHPFARDAGPDKPRALPAEFEVRSTIKRPAAMGFDIERDPDAKGILEQLRHHLDSVQTDVEGTTDVATALSTTQAALDVFNWRHLKETEYHQVYGVNAT